jgi:cytochrome c551/c552
MELAPVHEESGRPSRSGICARGALGLALLGACTCAGAAVAAAGGDPELGRALFADKACIRCHQPRGSSAAGPPLEALRRPQGEMELAGRLWNHVPAMFVALAQESSQWPRLTPAEMADLMAYLLADSARDPAPDPSKGQSVLLRKGCLKCHSLAREGGRVEPDLADRRADYESAAAWAATMWTHTPAMAAMAARQGIPYPRFDADDMGNLLGFLKQVATNPPARRAGTAPAR